VSSSTQSHIDLVLRDAVKEYIDALADRIRVIYADQSAKGALRSGATIRLALQAIDDLASDAVQCTSAKVLAISRDADAFASYCAAINDLLELYRDELAGVIRIANGSTSSDRNSSAETAAYVLFGSLVSKLERKLQILQFEFSKDPQAEARGERRAESGKTGRPRASFWDDMWAAIARDLYEGDLKPQTQADIETAMFRWIESHGHSAAVSTVRSRARRLWDQISG
jgi:hypothetical protein